MPISADMHDHRQRIDAELYRFARRVGSEHQPPIASPKSWDALTVAGWLEVQAPWVARQGWVVGFTTVLRGLVSDASGMAAWSQKRTTLPLPCPKCEQMTLTLFGGEDWVTCVASGCDEIIGWYRYSRLVNAIVALHQHHGETA